MVLYLFHLIHDCHDLQLIVFYRTPPGLFYRVFCFILIHLAIHDVIRIQTELVQHVLAVDDHIRQLFFHMLQIICIIAPLEALQQFICFDRNGLREVCR